MMQLQDKEKKNTTLGKPVNMSVIISKYIYVVFIRNVIGRNQSCLFFYHYRPILNMHGYILDAICLLYKDKFSWLRMPYM